MRPPFAGGLLVGFCLMLTLAVDGGARAETLPAANALATELDQPPRVIAVIEPHLSAPGRPVEVRYRGWPAELVLDRLLGPAWRVDGVEVEFRALDGYVSRIPSERFARHRAYLVFERLGHRDFTLDNPAQNEKDVPLAPYYLVWDNRDSPELVAEGATYWPYQVDQVLVSRARKEALLPPGLAPGFERSAAQTQKHCLSCHQVNGYGGEKWPGNLAEQARALSPAEFVRWVVEPNSVRPGTTMPGLPAAMALAERESLAREIHRYLLALPRQP